MSSKSLFRLCAKPSVLLLLLRFCISPPEGISQTNPIAIGHATNVSSLSVGVFGTTVLAGWSGVQAFDVHNPTNPVPLGYTNNGGAAEDLLVSGKYAYVANGNDGLRVYDISNPTNLFNVGHANDLRGGTNGYAAALACQGNYVYLADGFSGFRIYDVSDPAHPFSVADDFVDAVAVAVSGTNAYVAAYQGYSIYSYDISNPLIPVNRGGIQTQGSSYLSLGLEISANHLYYANGFGLLVYSITNAASPTLVQQLETGGAHHLKISGNYLYLANSGDLRIYDITNPANPVNVGQAPDNYPVAWANAVAISRGFAYLANGNDGLRIYSIGVPSPPPLGITSVNPDEIALFWPAPAPGFVVQQITNISTAQWATLTNESVFTDSRNQVIVPRFPSSSFYRLLLK